LSTASLVEAVLTLQEQREQRPLAEVLPPQTSVLPGTSREESATTDPRVSMTDSDRHLAASTSAASAAAADVNGV